jgi:pilus assembly protein Flp/PilA
MSLVIRRFLADERGATAIEYALISTLIAIVIVASLTAVGTQLQNTFNEVSGNLK